jgi:hypothetical protein
MSDSNEPDFVVNEVVDPFHAPDLFLQDIADLANRAEAGFSLTLYLPWGIARGTVVSAKTFFESIEKEFAKHPSDDELKPMAEVFSSMMGRYAKQVAVPARSDSEERDDDDLNPYTPRFITLQNAQVLGLGDSGMYPAVGTVPFLRVQISHVSAWSLNAPKFD